MLLMIVASLTRRRHRIVGTYAAVARIQERIETLDVPVLVTRTHRGAVALLVAAEQRHAERLAVIGPAVQTESLPE